MMKNVEVVQTLKSTDPHRAAAWFQTFLAVDKGVPSRIVSSHKFAIVVADDNRAIRFEFK